MSTAKVTTTASSAETDPADDPDQIEHRAPALLRGINEKLKNMVDMVHFFVQVFAMLPRTAKYSTEVARQAGILIRSSGFVMIFIQLVSGFTWIVNGIYIHRQVGTTGYVAVMPTWGGLRLAFPEMIGWILAAKVGCGLVAEIGSARISEEIDALEVMGVDSRVYLVATRVLASFIVMPFIFSIGLFLYYLGAYVGAVILYGAVSSGGFLTVLWITQNAADILFSFLIGLTCWIVVILIGCYYGYFSTGGPVGVGRNTAKSMMVNIIWVGIIGMILGQTFWGFTPNAPISN